MIKKIKSKAPDLTFQAEKAMQQAVRKLIVEKKKNNQPLIVWRNGKAVKIPAKEL